MANIQKTVIVSPSNPDMYRILSEYPSTGRSQVSPTDLTLREAESWARYDSRTMARTELVIEGKGYQFIDELIK